MRLPCVLIGSVALFFAGQAQAELPPLPDAERLRLSDAIVDVTVGEIRKAVTGSETYCDNAFTARVFIVGVHKGKAPKKGTSVLVHYWQAAKRPDGWTGPGGQYQGLVTGERVKLFLSFAGKDRYELLNPNGWTKLKPESVKKPR